MADEELIARLRTLATNMFQSGNWGNDLDTTRAAADRIEELLREAKGAEKEIANLGENLDATFARAERLEAALREIAAEASVTVHTWKNGINFKKMYEGWRKIAVERIDIARAALTQKDQANG